VRLSAAVCVCIAFSNAALAQEPAPTVEQTIDTWVFGCCFNGWGVKQMRRAGDSAAVALTRVLTDRELSSNQIESAAYILDSAFSEPSWIEKASDREPKTALLILRYLDRCTQDIVLKGKIAEARTHIIQRAAVRLETSP
jgi:hypothetical protein